MGGLALKNCTTRRYSKDEYFPLEAEVVGCLKELFPASRVEAIKAYANKDSFGDMDVLVELEGIEIDITEGINHVFQPKELSKNGNVISFEYKEFQIDVILTKTAEFNSSVNYFAYNDLGNLLGRIAHSIGLKLGHDGLSYNWRVETYQFRNVILLTEFKDILPILGLSYKDYEQGFNTLEDIFKFVVSSPFFNKEIYLLENRNNASRVRDRKRKTYTEFLKWIEDYKEEDYLLLNSQNANKYLGMIDKKAWLPQLFRVIPGFEETYKAVQAEWEEEKRFKSLYSGDVVREVTGYDGKELGEFMKWHREFCGIDVIRTVVLSSEAERIQEWILYFKEMYELRAREEIYE